MGTSLANRSGPVTLGSVGLTGRALTSGAPERAKATSFTDFNQISLFFCVSG